MHLRLLTLLAASTVVVVHGTANAQPIPVTLRFSSENGTCATESSFRDAVTRRNERVSWQPTQPFALVVRVRRTEGEQFTGSLRVTGPGPQSQLRRVNGTCKDVMAALSLFAAIAVHGRIAKPNDEAPSPRPSTDDSTRKLPKGDTGVTREKRDRSRTSPGKAETERAKTKEKTTPAKTKEKTTPAKTKEKTTPSTKPKPPEPAAKAARSKPMTPDPRRGADHDHSRGWRWGVGAGGGVTNLVPNGIEPAITVFASLERRDGGWQSAAFRAGSHITPHRVTTLGPAEVTLRRFAAHLSGCPVRWSPTPWLSTRPCIGFEAGAFTASSTGLSDGTESVSAWLSTEASGRIEALLHARLGLEVEGGIGAPLLRPKYLLSDAPSDSELSLSTFYGTGRVQLHLRF